MRVLFAAALTLSLLAGCASSAPNPDITLATWNMGWLTDRAAEVNGPNPARPIR